MARPLASSSLKCSQLAQCGTRLELAISTRGALLWVLNTPTGLPDCTSRVSSSFRCVRLSTIWSYHSQLRAARPMPPYTTSSFGFSATCGSRLFISMRSGASVSQLLAVSVLPRAARISTSRYFVGLALEKSVTTRTPQRSMRELDACEVDSYAHTFTCTYKHMQSSGQLSWGAGAIVCTVVRKPWKLRLRGLMKFLTGRFYSEAGLPRQGGVAPPWGIR